ncbi:MAG: hypothetical protein ACXIVO_09105 [Glycocaulis sp.]
MKKNTIIIAGVIAATVAASVWVVAEGQFIPAKNAVAERMLDPSSVQFRNLRRVGAAICGEVNSKNRYGAYVGFADFVYVPSDYAPPEVRIWREEDRFAFDRMGQLENELARSNNEPITSRCRRQNT